MNWKAIGIGALVSLALGFGVSRNHLALSAQANARTLYQQALHQEDAVGDLKAAITLYERVLSAGPDRTLAAQALLRLAGAYQKLGDSKAPTIYERIVRDYADQAEAVATARARLGQASRPESGIGLRRVFEGDFLVAISPDGRYMIHHNGLAQDSVNLRDLSTGAERKLDGGWFMDEAKFSKDGAQVAYATCGGPSDACEVRIVNVQSGGKTTPRRLHVSNVGHVGPIDWSPDGKVIAVYVQRRAEQILQLGLLRVSDGSLQVLQSLAWGGALRGGFFSPDGRDLALGLQMTQDDSARDIVLMDVQGKSQTPLVTGPSNDFPLGWSPDGRHLLFASDRSGSVGVWAQAVANRKPLGAPTLVKANLGGDVRPTGVTRSGALYVGIRTFSQDIELAPIDLAAGKHTGPSTQIRSAADRTWLPAWSRDGESLAYVLVRNGSENTVGIHSTRTGAERELHLGSMLDRVRSLSWAPDGSWLAGWGRDLKGRYGIFRIDANDGRVTPIVFRDPPPVGTFRWSSDGKKMSYVSQGGIYDSEGDIDRPLVQLTGPTGPLSPDGRQMALLVGTETGSSSGALVIQQVGGGAPRELFRFNEPEQFNVAAPKWTPDGRSVMVLQRRGADERKVLLVPVDGTPPRTLDFDMSRMAEGFPWFELSPDGRQIAYLVGEDRLEVWALENFLSALK